VYTFLRQPVHKLIQKHEYRLYVIAYRYLRRQEGSYEYKLLFWLLSFICIVL
jgi:hypothetical protein